MKHTLAFKQVDAFTNTPFQGNPAAVCLVPGSLEESLPMQAIAMEMNLSETAFLRQLGPCEYALRWFTPLAEVALCGHATLASAHVLWEEDLVPVEARITFQTLSGPLYASLDAGWIQLAFPLLPESHSLSEKRLSVLSTIIDCPILHAGQNHLGDILAVVDSEAAVRGVTPDFTLLAQVESRGLLVTAEATDSRYDFISRCFFPRLGIPEDPVTGSAHCYLADYWGKRLQKETLLAYQASPRGGVLKLIRLDNEHLLLMGQAITTLTGEIHHVTPEKLVPLSSRPSPP